MIRECCIADQSPLEGDCKGLWKVTDKVTDRFINRQVFGDVTC